MKNFFKHKMRNKSPLEIVGIVIFGGIAITGLAILLGFVIMWLWNWLMPELFGLTRLNYWQAVGLFILLKLLLGGCGRGSSKNSCKSSGYEKKNKSKTDFSKWERYDQFWEEEGDELYNKYLEKQLNKSDSNKSESEER